MDEEIIRILTAISLILQINGNLINNRKPENPAVVIIVIKE